jgi:hypothetical protein
MTEGYDHHGAFGDTSASAMSQSIDRRQHFHQLRRATEKILGCLSGDVPARTEAKNVSTCDPMRAALRDSANHP